MTNLLIVEDHETLGYVLKEYLSLHGYKITLIQDGNEALNAFKRLMPDLCILDVMLPNVDGFQIAESIKSYKPEVPIIFLTARALKVDKIKGFKLGADDYIVKPVDEEELLLRINSVLKRVYSNNTNPNDYFDIGRLRFEYCNRTIIADDKNFLLTEKESEILAALCERKGNLVSRDAIMKRVWRQTDYFTARTMDVHLSKIRKLLSIDSSIKIINVHGKGFILSD